jgi:hypothetical protein
LSKISCRLATYLEDRETEFLVTPVRVTLTQSLPAVEIGSFRLPENRENDTVEVPRWVGECLKELGFAEMHEEPFDVELFKATSRERIAGSFQLATLRSDFYLKLRHYFTSLQAKFSSTTQGRAQFDKMGVSAYDLVTLRTFKILQIAASSSAPPETVEKLTPEEKILYGEVRELVISWRKALLQGSRD